MHNFWMNTRRYKALILAVLPFLITGVFALRMQTATGWDGLAYFIYYLFSYPVLLTMSILSAVFAFSKTDPERKYIRTAKITSIVSLTAFGGVALIGIYGLITSVLWSH